jgi:hypothetical protein
MLEIVFSQNLIAAFLFILMGVYIVFDLERFINKILYFFISGLVLLILFFISGGLELLPVFSLSIFLFCLFLVGFTANRAYIYILAIAFLIITLVFYILGRIEISETTAIISFLLLAMGVVKDVFYEKIFDK